MVKTRFKIRPGAHVIGVDGEIGRVDRVVVSPRTGEVTWLVVRKGLLLPHDILIPTSAVEQADDDVVRVSRTKEEVAALPEYRDADFISAGADGKASVDHPKESPLYRLPEASELRDRRAVRSGQVEAAAGGLPLRAGQTVEAIDGEVGTLDLVLLDPRTRRVTHFVVRRGGLLGKDTIVPVDWVRAITRDRIVLGVTRLQLDPLPEYRPDDEITSDVLDALWFLSDLFPEDLIGVDVQTHDGIVELTGVTRTEKSREAIEAVARGIRGVRGVRNHVNVLEELAEDSTKPSGTGRAEAA